MSGFNDLEAAGTATVSDLLGFLGLHSGALEGLQPTCRAPASCAGPAVTVSFAPAVAGRPFAEAPLLLGEAVDHADPGSVLILAGGGENYAFWGDHLSEQAAAAGLAGVVVDGGVRDVAGIDQVGLPVFARARTTPQTYLGRLEAIALDRVVECGGREIAPGDVVVADEVGVLVVPDGAVEAVRRGLAAFADFEDWITAAAAAGAGSREIYAEMERRGRGLRQ